MQKQKLQSKNHKLKMIFKENERSLRNYLNNFTELYKISHNSEKLFATLSSIILVASFSFIKLLPEADFKILLLIGWMNFLAVDIIIVWNQIHYRNAFLDKQLLLIRLGSIKTKKQKDYKDRGRIIHNFGIALSNISCSLQNAQLLFITGIFFILGFSIINYIGKYCILFLTPLLIIWIWTVIRNFQKPLLYKNDKSKTN